MCPNFFRWTFGNRKFCCQSLNKENNSAKHPDCDGGFKLHTNVAMLMFLRTNFPGEINHSTSEKCCKENKYIPCPGEMCIDHESGTVLTLVAEV